jgi:hypothetical protein
MTRPEPPPQTATTLSTTLRCQRWVVAVSITALSATMISAGCGETIDLATTTTTTATTPAETVTGADPETPTVDELLRDDPESVPLEELVDALVANFQGLDDDAAVGDRNRLETILSIWVLLEPRLISERSGLHHGFNQAVDLAMLAVERRRPADATKAQRIALEMRASALG